MPTLEQVFNDEMQGNPPSNHVGRDGRIVNNIFTWPETYNVNTAYSELNSGSNAYGVEGAKSSVGTALPVAEPAPTSPNLTYGQKGRR